MSLDGPAVRLSVCIGEDDQHHGHPLYQEIVHGAHAAGLSGASVFRGIEGYGCSNRVHTTRLLSLSQDLPLAVVIIDTAERINAFLSQVTEIVSEGLVITDDVHVVQPLSPSARGSTRTGPAHRCNGCSFAASSAP